MLISINFASKTRLSSRPCSSAREDDPNPFIKTTLLPTVVFLAKNPSKIINK